MVWSDEPTDSQINALYRWLSWNLPTAQARSAVKYLRDNSTRREVSIEMSRIKALFDSHALTKDNAFESEIWDDYKDFIGQRYE